MSDKITALPDKFSALAAAVAAIRKDLPAMLEMQVYIAQMRKASYDAHIAQGFTHEQALALCVSTRI